MKFPLSTLILFITIIGCRDKAQESEYEWVQLQAPDTVYMNGLVVTQMTTMVKKYKDETLEQCIKRMDSTYGTNLFSVHYVNQLLDIEVSGEVIDSDALRINDSTIVRFNSVGRQDGLINRAILADSPGWDYDVDTATTSGLDYKWDMVSGPTYGSLTISEMGITESGPATHPLQKNLKIKAPTITKGATVVKTKSDTVYIYRDTCFWYFDSTYICVSDTNSITYTSDKKDSTIGRGKFFEVYTDYARRSLDGKWYIDDCEKALEILYQAQKPKTIKSK